MKKFLFVLGFFFTISLNAINVSPEWLIYIDGNGKATVYDDGCPGAVTIVYENGTVENYGGPC